MFNTSLSHKLQKIGNIHFFGFVDTLTTTKFIQMIDRMIVGQIFIFFL